MIDKEKERRKRISSALFCLGIFGIGFIGGILIGMILQQMIFTASAVEFGESLEGTNFNIEIDINETMLIEGFREVSEDIFNNTGEEEWQG